MTKSCSTVIAALPESSSTRQRRGCDVDSATAAAAWWKVVGAAALDSARSPRTWDLVTIANEEAAESPIGPLGSWWSAPPPEERSGKRLRRR